MSGGTNGGGETFEHRLERGIFATRWLLAPIYVGLVAGLVLVVIKFFQELWKLIQGFNFDDPADELTVDVLTLVDIALLANLIIIVIFAGYENFVSRLSVAEDHVDKPAWMGHVDFSGLKMKLIGSLVAISAILLLKDFVDIGNKATVVDYHAIGWQIGIHLTFVFSGLVFAIMDYWGAKRLKVLAELHAPDVVGSATEPFDPGAA